MIQMIEQTRDEKIAMYMNLTKRELVEMVINCNELLTMLRAGDGTGIYAPSPMFSIPLQTTTTRNTPF